MNCTTTRMARWLLPCLLAVNLSAQTPENAPPWWGVQDNVTVSLYWSFDGPNPLQPLEVAVPPWYDPQVTRALPAGPLTVLPNFQGRNGVLALVGNGTPLQASLAVKIDNDPHYNWVKIFWLQYEEFEGASGSIAAALAEDLIQYKRSAMTTTQKSLGGGWNQVTITAMLIPQPDDEEVDFSFTEQAFGTAAIDNLYVNSKCIKVIDSDMDGDALGQLDGFAIDLTAATGNAQCLAAAVTQGPAPGFQRSYWVSALAPVTGAVHQVFRLNEAGALVGTTLLPDTLGTAPNGASDLAVETVTGAGGTITQFVYALLDLRSGGPGLLLRAIDTSGSLTPTRNILLSNLPANFPAAPHRFGLAFQRSGQQGQGSFWITDQLGNAYEFARNGSFVRRIGNLPPNVVGAGYDEVFGNFYWFSSQPRQTARGPVAVVGYEWSGYDLEPTGTTFYGNLQLPNPGGPRGGTASGLEVYRRRDGSLRATCVVQTNNRSMLYELKGPFRFGASLLGTIGMQGAPVEGANNFRITLHGAPNAAFAALYAGFAPRNPMLNLSSFGLPETNALVQFDLNSALQMPVAPGRFEFNLPLPGTGFANVPMFFQWLVFDPSVPGGITMSPGGKTMIY